TLTNSNNAVATLAKDGSGSLAFTQAGALTVGTVDGVSGLFASSVDLRLSSGDLTLAQPVIATGTGNAVVLSTPAAFLNNAGANGVQASAGRWLIYSASPADNTFGGLVSGQAALWDRTIATQAPGSVSPSGNRYLFALSPELSVEALLTDSKTYGDTYLFPGNPVRDSDYALSGFVDAALYGHVFEQDDAASIGLSGAPELSSTGAVDTAAVGTYSVAIAQGTLANSAGYTFADFVSGGQLTVTARQLTVIA